MKDDQFERAAEVADATDLSLQQVAEREGHILKVSHTRGITKHRGAVLLRSNASVSSNFIGLGASSTTIKHLGRVVKYRDGQLAPPYFLFIIWIQVSTRKTRSASSFESINRAASLFIAWMRTRVDLQENADRKDASIFYPSGFKVTSTFQ